MKNEKLTKDALFTEISRKFLGINSLEPRNSDALDFHRVSVWQIKAAINAAYEAGKKETNKLLNDKYMKNRVDKK